MTWLTSARRSPRFQVQRSSSMAWSWRDTSTATRLRCADHREAPVHGEGAGHVEREGLLEVLQRQVDVAGLELQPGEVDAALVVGRVLLEVDDVGAVPEEEGGDGGDDAGLVGAADQEDGAGIVHAREGSRPGRGSTRRRATARDRRPGAAPRGRRGALRLRQGAAIGRARWPSATSGPTRRRRPPCRVAVVREILALTGRTDRDPGKFAHRAVECPLIPNLCRWTRRDAPDR